jgi:hypothetical protein
LPLPSFEKHVTPKSIKTKPPGRKLVTNRNVPSPGWVAFFQHQLIPNVSIAAGDTAVIRCLIRSSGSRDRSVLIVLSAALQALLADATLVRQRRPGKPACEK